MPGVDTIEALMAAVQAFDATPLGLQVDRDADAAVRESVRRTGLVLLGEGHGIAQTPVLMEELIAWFGLGGIALEWDEDLRPWLDRWITDGVLADPRCRDPAVEVWSGDGRLTAGHLAALRRWADRARTRTRWVGGGGASGTRRWPAGFSPTRRPQVADLWWPATCIPAWSRCRPATRSGRRSASRWGQSWLAGAPDCARSTVSTDPASSTIWVHAAAT